MPIQRRWLRACSAATSATTVSQLRRDQRSLSAMTWVMNAKTSGFPLVRHNVFFSTDYQAEFDDIFGRARLPREPTVYVCAQDRSDDPAEFAGGPERLLVLVNAPATGDTDRYTGAEVAECEERTFALLAAAGSGCGPGVGGYGADDAGGVSRSFSRDGRGALRRGISWLDGVVQQTGGQDAHSGTVSGGRQRASGAGRADGSAFGMAGGRAAGGGPQFDAAVAPGGYVWWYVDALSDDGRHGLSIIAFVGSVFSPYYKFARRKAGADPENHVAINVALYGAGGHRWTMTERGRRGVVANGECVRRGAEFADAGMATGLTFDIDEMTVPIPSRLKGRVRVIPSALNRADRLLLDAKGEHTWRPIAPVSRVEVAFENGSEVDAGMATSIGTAAWCRWRTVSGAGTGRGPATAHGATIFYDVTLKDGSDEGLSLFIRPDGSIEQLEPPALCRLPRAPIWRVERGTRSDGGTGGAVIRRRSRTRRSTRARSCRHGVAGRPVTAMHESLSLDRFVSPVVQLMLPFRMPRRAGR